MLPIGSGEVVAEETAEIAPLEPTLASGGKEQFQRSLRFFDRLTLIRFRDDFMNPTIALWRTFKIVVPFSFELSLVFGGDVFAALHSTNFRVIDCNRLHFVVRLLDGFSIDIFPFNVIRLFGTIDDSFGNVFQDLAYAVLALVNLHRALVPGPEVALDGLPFAEKLFATLPTRVVSDDDDLALVLGLASSEVVLPQEMFLYQPLRRSLIVRA